MLRSYFFNLLTLSSVLLWYFVLKETLNLSVDKLKYVYRYAIRTDNSAELFREIANLKLEISELKLRIKQHENKQKPSGEYEKLRQNLESDLSELMHSVRGYAQVENVSLKTPYFGRIQELHRLVTSHVWKLGENDGYKEFRQMERKELGRILQKRLEILQNPPDCRRAKKLLCSVDKAGELGDIVRQVVFCLMTAYASSRTLILNFKEETHNAYWNQTFIPLSETCLDPSGRLTLLTETWSLNQNHYVQVLNINASVFEKMLRTKNSILHTVPSDIALRLERVSSEPGIWWTGQFAKYILRLKPEAKRMLAEARAKNGFHTNSTSTITVGVHVKHKNEMGSNHLEEYKGRMEDYLAVREIVEGRSLKRKVFFAKEDQNLTVLLLLAECDFVICTYSSNICRLVTELKEVMENSEPIGRVLSLDFVYHSTPNDNSALGVVKIAKFDHIPKSKLEIQLKVGDQIVNVFNNWNGMSNGTNQRTKMTGLFLTFKAKNFIPIRNYPKLKWWNSTENL